MITRFQVIAGFFFWIVLFTTALFAYQDTESISIEFNDDPGTITCTPTALRYDKKHAISFDQDDNLRGVFKGILPLFLGGTPQLYSSAEYHDQAVSSGRFFKDPFGNEIHFRANTVSWVINENDIDYWEWATGWPAGGRLGYPDLDSMLNVNFGISSHAYYSNIHERGDDTVALCPTFYRNWLEKNTGHVPFSFDQPGGTTYNTDLWVDKWFEIGALYGVLGSGGGYAPVRVDNVDHSALTETIITARYSMESKSFSQLRATVDQLMAEDNHYWLRCFSHNLENEPSNFLSYEAFRDFTEYIDSAYADSIWVPGIHEIIQYFHVRDNVSFSILAGTSANEKTLQINTGSIPVYVKDRSLTFTLESSQAIASIDFNGHPANYKLLDGNTYLVDIDLSYEGTPVADPVISGPTEVPENSSGHVYSVDAIPNGHYEWILTGDATIASGDSTHTISVNMGVEDPEIHVRVSNDDGNAAYDMLDVTTTHIHYVKPVASGDGSGSSWANADDDLQAAFDDNNANQVWVAAGIYYVPDSIGFDPADGERVYGGFLGNENDTLDRALSDLDGDGTISPWEFTNATILSGDLDHDIHPDDYSSWPDNIGTSMDENAHHIIYQSSDFEELSSLNGFTFQGGNASGNTSHLNQGGAVYLKRNLVIKNCRFQYNISHDKGGAIYNDQGQVTNSIIINNISLDEAGGIYNLRGTVNNCWIKDNYADNIGGGAKNYGVEAVTRNCKIYENNSNDIGGGIHNYFGTLTELEVYSNESAGNGAGVYLDQGNINSCTVYENTATGSGSGGGIYSYRAKVDNSEIFRNSASGGGGGVLMRGDTISNSLIYDNQTTLSYAYGGGLRIQDATDQAYAVNLVVYNNKSLKYGGGIYSDNANVINCTVVNNYSADDAGGMYNNSSSSVVNTVVWGNSSADSDPQMNSNGSITYSAVEGSAPSGTGNISLNAHNENNALSPYFIQPTAYTGLSNSNESLEAELEAADWDIGTSSALAGSGTETNAPSADIDGISRIGIDIGAYESPASEIPTPIRLKGFSAILEKGYVRLNWVTESETENAAFNIYRNAVLITSVEGAGTSTEKHCYEFIDTEIIPGNHTYILADVSYSGIEKKYTDKAINIQVDEGDQCAFTYHLGPAYPNPFNPSTTISFSIEEHADVELSIHSIYGQLLRSWTYSNLTPGIYKQGWDARDQDGELLSSGLYLYTISANDFVKTGRLVYLK